MDNFAFGLRASNGSIDTSESDQWSASERALRVSQNDALQAKLNAEIHRSGFLTSAGHRAVVQKFLHSEEVDQEMAKARDAKPQEGLFRRLFSSDGSVTGSTTSSMTSSAGSINSSWETRRGAARRRSSASIATSLRRSFTDLFLEIDCNPCEDHAGDYDANDRVGRNIAPRRASIDREMNDLLSQLNRLGGEETGPCYVGRNIAPRSASIDREMSDVLSQLYGAGRDEVGRRPRQSSRAGIDDEDEAPESLGPDENGRCYEDASYEYVDACANDILSSLRRSFSSVDVKQIEGDNDSCADECGWLPWPERIEGDDDSCTDECGWLSWPER